MCSSLIGQHVKATLTADTNAMLIGDHLKVELSVIHPLNVEVSWPALGDTLGNFEVLAASAIDSSGQGNIIQRLQKFTLTIFDSGSYEIPAIPIYYGKEGRDSTDMLSLTEPISIEVATVAVDTSQAIKPIKDPIDAPYTLKEIASWLGLILLIAAIVFAAYWYWKKQQQKPRPIVAKPKVVIPPHEIAIQRIKELEEKKLWQQGEVKLYYVELTDILRHYIEGRFYVPALESTTDEIMDGLKLKDIPDQHKKRLNKLLSLADFVKFAKLQPGPGENIEGMEIAKDFINGTKPKFVKKESEASKDNVSDQHIKAQPIE